MLFAATSVVAGAACDRNGAPVAGEVAMAGERVRITRRRSIAAGVCDAALLAGSSIDSARATFYGQSHDGLHLIARGLEDVDRAASAALLEAKQKVEAALSTGRRAASSRPISTRWPP